MLVSAVGLQEVLVAKLFAAEVAVGLGVENARRLVSRQESKGGERVEGGQAELTEGESALVDVGHLGVQVERRGRQVLRRGAGGRRLLAPLAPGTAAAALQVQLALDRRRDRHRVTAASGMIQTKRY